MRRTRIAGTDLTASQIAFGTAYLHHLSHSADRDKLVLAAFDAGMSHFDTSPLYGFGIAETALAALKATSATIATKVGLYPPGGSDQGRASVLIRKVAGKFMPRLSKPIVDLSVARARRSIEESLRRLGREHIDILLLHEPDYSLVVTEEWLRFAENCANRVRYIGIAGESEQVLPFIAAKSPLVQIIQTRDSAKRAEASAIRQAGASPQLTYGHLANSPGQDAPPSTLLRAALSNHPDEIPIVSTRRADRIAEFVRAAA